MPNSEDWKENTRERDRSRRHRTARSSGRRPITSRIDRDQDHVEAPFELAQPRVVDPREAEHDDEPDARGDAPGGPSWAWLRLRERDERDDAEADRAERERTGRRAARAARAAPPRGRGPAGASGSASMPSAGPGSVPGGRRLRQPEPLREHQPRGGRRRRRAEAAAARSSRRATIDLAAVGDVADIPGLVAVLGRHDRRAGLAVHGVGEVAEDRVRGARRALRGAVQARP